MTDYKDIVKGVIKYSDRVRQISRPLKDHFGITYFYHFRIDVTGRMHILSNNPDVEEFYFSDKIYLNDPYVRHPNNYNSGFVLMEANGPNEWRDSIDHTTGVFNFIPCISLIQKNIDSVEFFGFWKDKNTSSKLDEFHLNHPDHIKQFATHFRNELKPALLELKESSNYIQDIAGKDHFYANLPLDLTIENSSLRSYLVDMGLGSEIAKADSLSRREKQCLKLLVLCKSAKEIAFELGLSTRTVEKYLDNCKGKLSCWSKQELFSATKNLEELGLL